MTSPPGPLHALFADATVVPPEASELAWYRQQFPADAGLVLDVACGIGRVLVPLAAQGQKVHGVDASEALLERCTARLAACGAQAPTFRQPLPQLNLPFRYGGAYVADGALQAFTDPATMHAVLERIRAHLVAPGTLVIDCRIPPQAQQRLAAPLVEVRTARLADGSQIALRAETAWTPQMHDDALAFTPAAAGPSCAAAGSLRAERRYVHRRGAQRLAEEHESLRAVWFAPADLLEAVRAAGFHDARVSPSPSPLPADEAFAVIARV
ncbi:MAG: class I SAM-dependent methyltransferase [Burkholderiales bacterium]